MTKRILLAILAAIIALSTTCLLMGILVACASNTQSDHTPDLTTTAPTTNSTPDVDEPTIPSENLPTEDLPSQDLPSNPNITPPDETEPEPKVEILGFKAEKFNLTEILQFSEKMVKVSSTEELCYEDIFEMGCNFYQLYIASFRKENLTDETLDTLSENAYQAFCNVFIHTRIEEIDQSCLLAWGSLPSKDLLIKIQPWLKYGSYPVGCPALSFGVFSSDEDAYAVALEFLCSDEITPHIAEGLKDCVRAWRYPQVQEIAFNRLLDIASSNPDEETTLAIQAICQQIRYDLAEELISALS